MTGSPNGDTKMFHQNDEAAPVQAQPTPKAEWQLTAEARIRDLKAVEEAEREEKRTADRDFIKVYPQGWQQLRRLIDDYPLAAKMYAFLAEHIDAGIGAVVASQALMAEELEISERTIRRLSKYLEDSRVITRIKIQGNLCAYALNPEEVWKSWKDNKNFAAFNTRTLARNKENPDIKRRLKLMLKNKKEDTESPPLPGLEPNKEGQ